MEGLGEGYEAFVERLQSDFAVSKSSAQNGNPNPNPNPNPKPHPQIPSPSPIPSPSLQSQASNPNPSQIASPNPGTHSQMPGTSPVLHGQIHNGGPSSSRGGFSSPSSPHPHHQLQQQQQPQPQPQQHSMVGASHSASSHSHPPKYVGYPSPANAFTLKKKNEEDKERERERERGGGGIGGIGAGSHALCASVGKDEKAEKPENMATLHLPPGFRPISRTFSSDTNAASEEEESQPYTMEAPKGHHRRSQSEIAFRLPDDITFDYDQEYIAEFHEPNDFEDDFFSSLDFDKMNLSFPSQPSVGSNSDNNSGKNVGNSSSNNTNNINMNRERAHAMPHHSRSFSVDQMFSGFNTGNHDDVFGIRASRDDILSGHGDEGHAINERPRHRHSHSFSIDGSSTSSSSSSLQPQKDLGSTSASSESSKSVSANKLAELALIDPKRAKRILANRQSAARSKERKMRYIAELERKVQALQSEATALSTQLTIMQNDTTVLTAENNELKFQLKTLEQQTHLSNALNIALKEEFQRLKIATGEVGTNGHLRSREDHLLADKPFYRTQPIPDTTGLATQQLQQIRSALRKQQHVNHPNNSLA